MIVTAATGSDAKCCLTRGYSQSCPSGDHDFGTMENTNVGDGNLCCPDFNIDPNSSSMKHCSGSGEEMVSFMHCIILLQGFAHMMCSLVSCTYYFTQPKLRGAAMIADKFIDDAFVEAVATKIADAVMKKIDEE